MVCSWMDCYLVDCDCMDCAVPMPIHVAVNCDKDCCDVILLKVKRMGQYIDKSNRRVRWALILANRYTCLTCHYHLILANR